MRHAADLGGIAKSNATDALNDSVAKLICEWEVWMQAPTTELREWEADGCALEVARTETQEAV